ncbi:MAG: hypothetical protein LBM87_00685 [Ruminococcus sp.]|jgi:transposase-like protein|nr:hypothetical protein [Ruminococcus sp.]
MRNKYVNVAQISEQKFRELIKCFALDLSASDTGKLINHKISTVNRVYNEMRFRIYDYCFLNLPDSLQYLDDNESFRAYSKHRLMKYSGIQTDKFPMFLKETEFRFINRHNNLYKILLKMFRDDPLF